VHEQHLDQPLDRGFRSDLVAVELAHQQAQRRLQGRVGAFVGGRDVKHAWEEREQRMRELVVVAESGAEEARSGARPGMTRSPAGVTSSALRSSYRRARRERKRQREEQANLAHLTGRQRLGIALSEMTVDDMRDVRDGLLAKAKAGDAKAVPYG
jgi:hypothetical protein